MFVVLVRRHLECLNRACIGLGNLYNLVIFIQCRRNVSKDRLAVSNTVLKSALNALISLDNLALKAVPLIRYEPLRITKGAFILTAHRRHCEEVVSHDCEGRIELLATLTLLPQ
jgi:hypothetical protein